MRIRFTLIVFFLLCFLGVRAQNLTGTVTDFKTGEALPFVNIYYEGTTIGVNTKEDGSYSIRKMVGKKLTFSYVGYDRQLLPIANTTDRLDVQLKTTTTQLQEATVKAKRNKYKRKNNPAVDFIRKVIAAKKSNDVRAHDFFSYSQYRKTTVAINDFTEKVFEEGKFKKMPFLKNHVEVNPQTGKLTLPISVHEETSEHIYRRKPESEKDIITGKRETGINKLFNTGEIMDVMIADCFTDVRLFDDNIRLLQYPFISPIASHNAIGFYHYFLADTLDVNGTRCVEVDFSPANPQDFGFTGSLFVLADSTYRVHKAILNIPKKSDVNFVEHLEVIQEFETLPTGEQSLSSDKMIVQIKLNKMLAKFQVVRNTFYTDYSTEEIPQKAFKFTGSERTDPNALTRNDTFWEEKRPEKLSNSEDNMDEMLKGFESMKHFKIGMLVLKAFIENFVETSTDPKHPSKFDFGPINTSITQNFVDGLRLRISGQTTANLSKHLFGKGYLAYGFKDERWKGMGELTYAFNPKAYLPREFPTNNLTVSYQSDVMSPSDKFLPTDKDNVFTSFKWAKVDQMMYFNRFRLRYEREYNNGVRIESEFHAERNEATAQLFYQPLDGTGTPSQQKDNHTRYLKTSEIKAGIYFQPHARYINTKQRRITVNKDAPCFALYHTAGLNGFLGGSYSYNLTEASIYKRLWVPGAGKIDMYLKGGAQWNKVPFPLLIMPEANLSYIKEDNTFNLVNNMEFLNDRYASLMVSWDLNGKIFNRIPLLRKLKWREFLSCNVLWGTLTDKNNPFKNPDDTRLFYFPGHFDEAGNYHYSSFVMDPDKPYIEITAGIHNIFKILQIEGIRRITYLDLPTARKWGLRIALRMTF